MESEGLHTNPGQLIAPGGSFDYYGLPERRGYPARAWRGTWAFTRRKPLGAAGVFVILVFCFVGAFANVIDRRDPNELNPNALLQAPSSDAWFGTDNLGRDLYSRVVHGTRVALLIGFVAVGLATAAGTAIGLVSGFYGGKVDLVIQRFVDAILAFPVLVIALAVVTAVGPSLRNLMLAIAFIMTPGFSRVVRASVLGVKQNLYIEAAQALGQTTPRILLRHVLPNVAAPIIVVATGAIGSAILAEASLSFLGLGPPPPNATWGSMLAIEARFYITTAWWLAVVPSTAITLAVLGFNLFGDALRDVWDPRLRGTK
jgi:peptide/nickel transport system permease protein